MMALKTFTLISVGFIHQIDFVKYVLALCTVLTIYLELARRMDAGLDQWKG